MYSTLIKINRSEDSKPTRCVCCSSDSVIVPEEHMPSSRALSVPSKHPSKNTWKITIHFFSEAMFQVPSNHWNDILSPILPLTLCLALYIHTHISHGVHVGSWSEFIHLLTFCPVHTYISVIEFMSGSNRCWEGTLRTKALFLLNI